MNKQRKVVITTTYNEMGIIIDTKVEEVAQPNLQPTCATDAISRQLAIDTLRQMPLVEVMHDVMLIDKAEAMTELMLLPPAEPEIIHCKDCGHRDDHGCCKYWRGLAMSETPIATDDYDFCKHAKRRNDVFDER
jgi:hypothetical protein